MPRRPIEPVEIDFTVLNFWDKVEGLLSDAGRYAHSYKLRENLNDEATRFKVEHVLLRYYDNDPRRLNDEIHFRRRQCFKAVTEISQLCACLGLRQIRDKEVLTELLLSESRRKGWRKLIKKYKNVNQLVSLQAIELEYRKNLQKAP
ncbi:hypothetical protein IKF88_02550 [Candidatus Saccharibacteria bacterium]|nr:hypothetical protein [Candidatus Saccharibacteria bacterium]